METTLMANEFSVDFDDDYGHGHLLVSDVTALFADGQSLAYDRGLFAEILDLGEHTWYIVASQYTLDNAVRVLGPKLSQYVNDYCMGKVWADAYVHYIGRDGDVLRTAELGFDDGSETLVFRIYINEFFDGNVGEDVDVIDVLSDMPVEVAPNQQSVPRSQLAQFLSDNAEADWPIVLVERDTSVAAGFTARGFGI